MQLLILADREEMESAVACADGCDCQWADVGEGVDPSRKKRCVVRNRHTDGEAKEHYLKTLANHFFGTRRI